VSPVGQKATRLYQKTLAKPGNASRCAAGISEDAFSRAENSRFLTRLAHVQCLPVAGSQKENVFTIWELCRALGARRRTSSITIRLPDFCVSSIVVCGDVALDVMTELNVPGVREVAVLQ
jgi:hypothetical protein